MTGYIVRTLTRVVEVLGEARAREMVAGFSCPRNAEVESFIRDKALHSANLETSVSYLVFREDVLQPIAYFTLSLKPVEISVGQLNSKSIRMLKRFARLNPERGSYTIAAYLIAQFARNFSVPESQKISGSDLMFLALSQIRNAKQYVGGKIAFLECEKNRPQLKKFYERNKFVSWSERTDAEDKISYEQMFTVLERKPTEH